MGYYNNDSNERFAMVHTLGKYYAQPVAETTTKLSSYVVDVFYKAANQYKDGSLAFTVYRNGVVSDIEIGQWTFSPIADGHYHIESLNHNAYEYITIRGVDISKEVFERRIRSSSNSGKVLAEQFFDAIYEMSKCPDISSYDITADLSNLSINNIYDIFHLCKSIEKGLELHWKLKSNVQYADNDVFKKHLEVCITKAFKVLQDKIGRVELPLT